MTNLCKKAVVTACLAGIVLTSPFDLGRDVTVTVVVTATSIPDSTDDAPFATTLPDDDSNDNDNRDSIVISGDNSGTNVVNGNGSVIIVNYPATTVTVYSTIGAPSPTISPTNITATSPIASPTASSTTTIEGLPPVKPYKPWCSTNMDPYRPHYWIHWPQIPNESIEEIYGWCKGLWLNLPWRTCPVDPPNGDCAPSDLIGGGLMWDFTSWRDCIPKEVEDAFYFATKYGSFGNLTCSIGTEKGPYIKPDAVGCQESTC